MELAATDPMAFLDEAEKALGSGGVFALLAVCINRLLWAYRLPLVQERLPERVRWDGLSDLGKLGLVLGGAALVGACGAVAGKPFAVALLVKGALAGVISGWASMGLYKTTAVAKEARSNQPASHDGKNGLVVPIPTMIIVNGKSLYVADDVVGYELILNLSGIRGQPTITYALPGTRVGGTLARGGDSIRVLTGMVFNVASV